MGIYSSLLPWRIFQTATNPNREVPLATGSSSHTHIHSREAIGRHADTGVRPPCEARTLSPSSWCCANEPNDKHRKQAGRAPHHQFFAWHVLLNASKSTLLRPCPYVDLRKEAMQVVVEGERIVLVDEVQNRGPRRLCLKKQSAKQDKDGKGKGTNISISIARVSNDKKKKTP